VKRGECCQTRSQSTDGEGAGEREHRKRIFACFRVNVYLEKDVKRERLGEGRQRLKGRQKVRCRGVVGPGNRISTDSDNQAVYGSHANNHWSPIFGQPVARSTA
jgi:hypothetical protein